VPIEIKFVGTWIRMSGNVTVAAPHEKRRQGSRPSNRRSPL